MTNLQAAKPASIWKRIVAGVIDYFILWLFIWPAVCAFGFRDADNEIAFMLTTFGWRDPLVPMFIFWLLPYALRDMVGARSFGKWLLGMRVVDSADLNARPTLERLILRNMTIWLSPAGMIAAALTPERMRFGDRLARTMVVEDPTGPSGPSWRVTITKAAIFAAVTGASIYFAQAMLERYYEGSRCCRRAEKFLSECEPMRELMPGAQASDRRFQGLHFFPTSDGAVAIATFQQTFGSRSASLASIVRRPPDNINAWGGFGVQAGFEPGWPADNAPKSSINDAALGFLKGYAPLHAAVRDLRPEKTTLDRASAFERDGREWAGAIYQRGDSRWAARFVVGLERRGGPWSVFDACGVVDLNVDNASTRRVYVFRKSKEVSRFLTGTELEEYLGSGKVPADAQPDFKMPGDNATTKR